MEVLVGPRRITRQRRVTIPAVLRRSTGMEAGSWVRADVGGPGGRLVLRSSPAATRGQRRPARPRRVTTTGQVTLPARLMRRVGLEVGDLVYLAGTPAGVKVVPRHDVGVRSSRKEAGR